MSCKYGYKKSHRSVAQNHAEEAFAKSDASNDMRGKAKEQLETGIPVREPMEGTDAYREREIERMIKEMPHAY